MQHRNKVLVLSMMVLVTLAQMGTVSNATTAQLSMTGEAVPELAVFDQFMSSFMAQWDMPGGALAVMRDGRLVFARGYGLANEPTGEVVEPDALFRIASVSKPFTSAAIQLLVERGELRLSDRVLQLLGDARLNQVTVEQVLEHSAGFGTRPDPMFESNFIADQLHIEGPPSCEEIISFFLTIPLVHAPGTTFDYSNYGYCVLAEVVAAVSGMSYEEFVQTEVLAPLGITQMQVGHSLWENRAPNETRSHPHVGASQVESVFPNVPSPVNFAYGGFNLEAMAGHGGWLASPVDLVRFVAMLERTRTPFVLSDSSVDQIFARPQLSQWNGTPTYYAQGWNVRPVAGGDANWWHDGALPYNSAKLVRRADGITFAVLFNSHPGTAVQGAFFGQLDQGLNNAANQVTAWPDHDLFENYLGQGSTDEEEENPLDPSLFVCASGCEYMSIQEAINAAQPGDVIGIEAGTYDETLRIENAQNLVLQGVDAAAVIIDGSGGVESQQAGIYVRNSTNITITNVTVMNARRGLHADVVENLSVRSSIFRDNLRSGIYVTDTRGIFDMVGVESTKPDTDGAGGSGFYLLDSDELGDNDITIRNSTSSDNSAFGVIVFGNSRLTMEGSTLIRNGKLGVSIFDTVQATIENSIVRDNLEQGVNASHSTQLTMTDSEVASNGLENVRLSDNSQTVIENSEIRDAPVDPDNFSGFGISLYGEAALQLRDSSVSENGQTGIYLIDQSTASIENTSITQSFDGVLMFNESQVTINNSTLQSNDVALVLRGESNAVITQSTIDFNNFGISLLDLSTATISNNTISNNTVCGVDHLRDQPGGIMGQNNTIFGNGEANLCGDLNNFPIGFGGGR